MSDYTYLMHHGIKGQKWGVENGPPYPLTPSKDYSAAEKKANKIYNKVEKAYNNSKAYKKVYDEIKQKYKDKGKLTFGQSSTISYKVMADDRTIKQVQNAKDNLKQLCSKYSNSKEIVKNINSIEKQINNILKDMDNIKLNDKLADFSRKSQSVKNAVTVPL